MIDQEAIKLVERTRGKNELRGLITALKGIPNTKCIMTIQEQEYDPDKMNDLALGLTDGVIFFSKPTHSLQADGDMDA